MGAIRPLPAGSDIGGMKVPLASSRGAMSHGVRNHDVRLGRLPLDLLDTVFEWRTFCVDRITAPGAWEEWLTEVGLDVPPDTAGEDILARMRELRRAVFLTVSAVIDSTAPAREALGTINHWAQQAYPVPRLDLRTDGSTIAISDACTHANHLTGIARQTIDLLSGPETGRLRICGSRPCPTVFYDSSPAGDRRWCSPQCAARAWSKAYRARRKAAADA